jgi:hypothetical protein
MLLNGGLTVIRAVTNPDRLMMALVWYTMQKDLILIRADILNVYRNNFTPQKILTKTHRDGFYIILSD